MFGLISLVILCSEYFISLQISHKTLARTSTTWHFQSLNTVVKASRKSLIWCPERILDLFMFSYSLFNGYERFFTREKAAGKWNRSLTVMYHRNYEWVDLYLHSPYTFMACTRTHLFCTNKAIFFMIWHFKIGIISVFQILINSV